MSAPQWWVIALPVLSIVLIAIVGLYANVKLLLEIKKLQIEQEKIRFETEKLRHDLYERERRIHQPTDEELRQYMRDSVGYLRSLVNTSERSPDRAAPMAEPDRMGPALREILEQIENVMRVAYPISEVLQRINRQLDALTLVVQGREPRS